MISFPESSISLLQSWAPRTSAQVFHTAGVQDSPPSMLASCWPWRPLQANLCYWSFVNLFRCCPHCWPPAKPPEVKCRLWHCPPGDFLCCQPLAMTPELATQSAPRPCCLYCWSPGRPQNSFVTAVCLLRSPEHFIGVCPCTSPMAY